jgi:hypothetical protein
MRFPLRSRRALFFAAAPPLLALAAALPFEIGLRLAGVCYDASLFTGDPNLGWALRPNAEGCWVSEGSSWVRINSDGMRDRERGVPKPPNTIRIAVLGDSFTEAREVALEHTFCSVLEGLLGKCQTFHAKRVEVLNFGVSGYGTAQELLMLRHKVWKYGPDIVLLQFYAGNDVFNNHRQLNTSPPPEMAPYFVYQGEELVLDSSFRRLPALRPWYLRWRGWTADAMNRSRVLLLLHEAFIRARYRLASRRPDPKAEQLGPDYQARVAYLPPAHPAMREAWRVTEELILLMREEVRARGAEFWLVVSPMGMQTHPDAAAQEAFRKSLGVDSLDYADRRIQALADRAQIPLILLAPELGAYAAAHRAFVAGFPNTAPGAGHLNELGHRLAARAIAARLCAAQEPTTVAGADGGDTHH